MDTTTRKFNEHVYALSELSYIHDSIPTRPRKMGPEEKKHLKILNGIALLLVTEDKSDVAAVTFRQTAHTIDVYYAKNSPSNDVFNSYVNSMLNDVLELRNSSLGTMICRVSMRAIVTCVKKVRSRVLKILECLGNILGDNLCDDDEIVKRLFPAAEVSQRRKSQLGNYIKNLRSLPTKDLESFRRQYREVFDVAMLGYHIGKWKGLWKYHERLQRRIQKLGDYYGAATHIARVCKDHRNEKIQVFEIKPPSPERQVVWKSPLKIMNAYCEKGKETDATKFTGRFPDLNDEPQKELTIKTSVHCELTVLLDSMTNTAFPIKIGVSKHCCWLCEKYIEAFQALYQQEKQLFVSGFQGKIPAGWLLPPGTPPAVETSMQKLLENELDEIRAMVDAQRRSDSWPAEDENDEPEVPEDVYISQEMLEEEATLWGETLFS